MEKAKLMQLEIEKKRKLPKEVKNNINTIIFQNLKYILTNGDKCDILYLTNNRTELQDRREL